MDHKEGCVERLILENTLESPVARSSQSVLKEINPEYSLDGEAEAPILWPLDPKSRLIGKDPDAGKIEGRRRSG